MPNQDRRPRAFFDDALDRFCEKASTPDPMIYIDRAQHPYLKSYDVQAWVERIWVVGSYARGALDCGDLDLLLEMGGRSRAIGVDHAQWREGAFETPNRNTVMRRYGKKTDNLSFGRGTPDENTYGVEFKEAVLIWEKGDTQQTWRSRMNAIKLDPKVGRFKRPYDDFPFGFNRIGDVLDLKDILIERRDQAVIEWDFIAFNESATAERTPDAQKEWDDMHYWLSSGGKLANASFDKLQRLAFSGSRFQGTWQHWSPYTGSGVALGGHKFSFGPNPTPYIHLLEDLSISALCLVPHHKPKEQNGIWRIQRGENHPLVKMANKLSLYTVRDTLRPDRLDSLLFDIQDPGMYIPETQSVLLTEQVKAQSICDKANKKTKSSRFEVQAITGRALLDLVAMSQRVKINTRQFDIRDDALLAALEKMERKAITQDTEYSEPDLDRPKMIRPRC